MKLTRRQLRKLIMESLDMGKDLGVQNLKSKGVIEGTPIVRGDKGYGGYYKVTGEQIALNSKNKFVDGDFIIGLLYRGLLYGLIQAGDYNLSGDDINKTKEINDEYKPYYGIDSSLETKRVDQGIISKELFSKFIPFYKEVIQPLKSKNKEYADKIFGNAAAIKLGKNLISKGFKNINPSTIKRNYKEYRENVD